MAKTGQKHHDPLPIPTYEEAISSRSQSPRGAREISDDAERQGLLGQADVPPASNGNNQPPSVESERPSNESLFTLPDESDEGDEGLQRDMEQMEVVDPGAERRAQQRARLRQRFSKHYSSLSNTISSIHFPTLPVQLPSFSFVTSRLPTISNQYKPGWPILARLFGLFVIVALVYGLVVLRFVSPGRTGGGQQYSPESVRSFVQGAVNPKNLERYLYQIAYGDHIAGTKGDYFLANLVEERFKSAKLDGVFTEDYEVYLNYPKAGGRRVAILDPPDMLWEAALEEEIINPNTDQSQSQSPVFHGYSKSGNVTGPLIYVNYGAREDFAYLTAQGINLNGSIALVRYYGTQTDRAMKVKAAELAGAAGCLIYSDPNEDGFTRGIVWPDGRWRPADSVQRGTVGLTSFVVGDILTPGWASTEDAPRISKDDNPGLVNIPSLPLAWRDAQVLLRSLQKHGMRAPANWVGGVPDIGEWWTGNYESSPTVQLMNIQDEIERQPIRNVIGKIQGVETPDKVIYVGNHRDAWCFGAVDPGSGTAVLLEVVRIFGQLMNLGWRPRRSIVFASWDGEEYNLIGSTEHVEERIDEIRRDGVAYLNVDVGVSGQDFWAAASPLFELPIQRVLGRVNDPITNISLGQLWELNHSRLEGLGAGSDYVAFQDLAGCSSMDFGFRGPDHAFPYHSCYETFDWMSKYGDPGFQYHAMLAQVWALLILELSDEAVIAFDFNAYAGNVLQYVADMKASVVVQSQKQVPVSSDSTLDVSPLEEAAELFAQNAAKFMEWEEAWDSVYRANGGMETRELYIRRLSHNARMSNFETHLLDLPQPDEHREGGVPGRTQFKHVIIGPQTWSGYDTAYFPAIQDAIDMGNWTAAQEQLGIVARVLHHAADKLLH